MNYIKRLEKGNEILQRIVRVHEEGLTDILRYINSSKFHDDPTVQVRDIELRIGEIRMRANDTMFIESKE